MSDVEWLGPTLAGIVGVVGGGFGKHLIDLLKARQDSESQRDQRDQVLITQLVNQQIQREQELWLKLGHLEKALENAEARLDKAVADANVEIEKIRREKHDAIGELHVKTTEVLLLQAEVNDELEAQGKPARYQISVEQLRVARITPNEVGEAKANADRATLASDLRSAAPQAWSPPMPR